MELSNKTNEVVFLNTRTLTTKEVAEGYMVSEANIKEHRREHQDEILENIHFIYESADTKGGKQEIVKWTLRGIIKLGMFIRSPQAKNFRIWAEQELEKSIKELEQQASAKKEIVFIGKHDPVLMRKRQTLKSFIEAAVLADSGSFVPNSYLYAVYRQYVSLFKEQPFSLKGFHTHFKAEFARLSIPITSAQKRMPIGAYIGFDNLKPFCTFGIRLSTLKLGFTELIINGERLGIESMNFIAPPNTFAYGNKLISISPNANAAATTKNEALIRQNERLLMENRRLKQSLFKAQNKDLK